MNDDNFNMIDQKFFLPKEDIFSVFLNAGENKTNENMNETLDQFFKVENNFNGLNNFLENNMNVMIDSKINEAINLINYNIFNDSRGEKVLSEVIPGKAKETLNRSEISRAATDEDKEDERNNLELNGFDLKDSSDLMIQKKRQASCKLEEISSFSFCSELTENRKVLFKTFKGDEEGPDSMKKMMRLMKNRLSARKCRQKKKKYFNNIEHRVVEMRAEMDKLKNLQKREKYIETMISNLDCKEKEILNTSQKKKIESNKKDHSNLQKTLLHELFRKMIKNITPLELKFFSNKLLKLKEFDSNDTFERLLIKIDENLEILSVLCNLNNPHTNIEGSNVMTTGIKILKANATDHMLLKLFDFFNNLKKLSIFFHVAFLDKLGK